MKWLIISIFLGASLADKLQNNYLPPSNARSAGGSEFLTAPSRIIHTQTRGHSHPSAGHSFVRSHSNSFNGPIAKSAALESTDSYAGPAISIVRSNSDNSGDGSYRFAYETENRIIQEEEGHLENAGTDHEANSVQGSYSFEAPDGQVYTVNYIADENGFRAFGDHLPTPPPVPEVIQKSILDNKAAEKYETESDVGYGRSSFGRTHEDYHKGFNGRSSNYRSAASRNYNEFDDLNGVEVGGAEIDVSRQYLTPNNKQREGGYRY